MSDLENRVKDLEKKLEGKWKGLTGPIQYAIAVCICFAAGFAVAYFLA